MAKQFAVGSISVQSFNSQHSTQLPSNSFVSCSEHKTKDIATQI